MTKKNSIPIVTIGSNTGKRILKEIIDARITRSEKVLQTVEKIVNDIRKKGDSALFDYTKKFDKKSITSKSVRISPGHISAQAKKVPSELKTTINEACRRIRAYHLKQKINAGFSMNTAEGRLEQIVRPLYRVGVYIPGGYTAYPSTVLMDVIPASIAGVKEIVAVTPPRDEFDPLIAYVLKFLKVTEIYQVGGAQAIGALAYGTESIPAVDKIVGPGNIYVASAKKTVYGAVDIDTVAGPSEVAVLADKTANPEWVALDLLAQAEHGSGDEIAVCVTENRKYADKVRNCLISEIENSSKREVFAGLSPYAISIFICKSRNESIEFINYLAPEHLQIITKTYRQDLKKVRNAAAIFLGPYTPVALGDYFVGTNHVLPTGSAARYASPLGVDSFIKRISVTEVNASGLKKAASHVSRFARAEKFVHHALSVERRLTKDSL